MRIQIGDFYVHRRFLILHGRTLYLIIEILKEPFYRFSCLDSDIAAGRMGTHHILIGNKSLDRALIQLFDQVQFLFDSTFRRVLGTSAERKRHDQKQKDQEQRGRKIFPVHSVLLIANLNLFYPISKILSNILTFLQKLYIFKQTCK